MTGIKKLNWDAPETKSADLVASNLETLKVLFPEAFCEGQIDLDVLKELLGASVYRGDEKFGLNWHGKRRARQIALIETGVAPLLRDQRGRYLLTDHAVSGVQEA